MIIGFSGSRTGMSKFQYDTIWDFLAEQKYIRMAIHGDCVGSDAMFHDMCEDLRLRIEVYPPVNRALRAWKIPTIGLVHDPASYLDRNQEIAETCTVLIATPKEPQSEEFDRQGGTWDTIKRAERLGKKIMVILPNQKRES